MKIEITGERLVQSIKWTIVVLIIPFGIWLWNLDTRLTTLESHESLMTRVKNIEDALVPILIEFRVETELARRLLQENEDEPLPIALNRVPEARHLPREEVDRVTKDAEKWAREQIRQEPTEE